MKVPYLQVWSAISTTIVQKAYCKQHFISTYIERRVSYVNAPSACDERICILKMTEEILIMEGFLTWCHLRRDVAASQFFTGPMMFLYISFDLWCSLEILLPVVPQQSSVLSLYLTLSMVYKNLRYLCNCKDLSDYNYTQYGLSKCSVIMELTILTHLTQKVL